MARPWFPLYAADLLVDGKVALLTDAQFRELVLAWCHACLNGGIPESPSEYARVMKCHGNHARKSLDWLRDFFVKDPSKPGRLVSERMAEEEAKYLAKVEKLRLNGSKGGRPQKAIAFPEEKQNGVEPQLTTTTTKENKESTPASRKRATKPKGEPETLEQILGGGKGTPTWEAYWKLTAIFGPGKNPAPKTTAKLYAYAVVGFSYAHIQEKAEALARSVSEPKYLPQLAKWLEGDGYRNPDQSTPTHGGTNGTRSPQHRAAGDAAWLKQLQDRNAAKQEAGVGTGSEGLF